MTFQDLSKAIKIFHGLSQQQLEQIKPHLEPRTFKKGDWIVKEGDEANRMYIVRHGSVEVWKGRTEDNKGFCLGDLGPGECFGEMALVDCQPRSASVLAKSDLSVFRFSYEAMSLIYQQDLKLHGLLIINIAREISRRLRAGDRILVEFALPRNIQSASKFQAH